MTAYEFPGAYYELIRADFRDPAETEFLASLLPAAGRVLDLGSGTGTTLRALAELGHGGVGVDPSEPFVRYAVEHGGPSVEYVHAAAEDFTTTERFDLVYSLFGSLNLVPRDRLPGLLAAAASWLRPGGQVVLEAAHLLNFVDSFQPLMVQHHRRDGVLVTRMARQSVVPHAATWRHDEVLLVREKDGTVAMYDNVADQSVLTLPELRDMLGAAGLAVTALYGGFRKEPPPRHGRGPLVIVASAAS
jgi:SAM-dependent methyltransferase